MGGSADEFPLLSALGLYAADIRGDGNCLFNALSDQLYGHQNEHAAIRHSVIKYMREHASYYKQFIDVNPGGGLRRNPKRKNVGAYSAPVNTAPPSEADIDRVFEGHLQSMAKGGVYGDNMEISAFSSAFDVDVKIYQADFAYMVSGGADRPRKMAHIAYHTWEHYSSIRNLDGPHDGLPHVQMRALSQEEEQREKEKLASHSHVLPWMIDVVSQSLPFLADKPTIKRMLEQTKGNIDSAVSKLLDAEEGGSASSAQESSSVEREQDSEDETYNGPNKKQDRRLSRAARQNQKDPNHRHVLSKLAAQDSSQESVAGTDSEASSLEGGSQDTATKDEEIGDVIRVKQESGTSSGTAAKPTIRFKINGPKPPSSLNPASRVTARDRKDIKKQAQKAARRERQQLAARGGSTAVNTGITLRSKGMTQTPPIESGFRTLFI